MNGAVVPADSVTEQELREMFALMTAYYDNMDETVFLRDFRDKQYCLLLRSDSGRIIGFTTQKVMQVTVDGRPVHGVFSGDTIIRRDFWGQTDLYRIFSQFWFQYAKQFDVFYWFLICKGYKTYGILPLIWSEFYPNYRTETPAYEKRIIDAYASALYPDEYNPETGVVEYRHIKDQLKPGVADIDARRLKNKDTAYFCKANPGHCKGNDIACLARLELSAVKPRMAALLGIC